MLQILSAEDFNAVYSLMQKSFPDDEYRTYESQRELMEKTEYKIYGAKAENGELQAIAAVWEIGELAFLEHLAVEPALRNRGAGTAVLRDLVGMLKKRLVLEVEPPINELTKRRIDFYRRNGFFLNTYPYAQPPLSEGKKPVPLFIMTYGRELNEREFENIKRVLYTDVYKCI